MGVTTRNERAQRELWKPNRERRKNPRDNNNMELHSALTVLIIPDDQESSTVGRDAAQKVPHWGFSLGTRGDIGDHSIK